MTALGMRFALGIAVLAGLGRFVPYLGPLILWIDRSVAFPGG
jgi:predicted PurR-regulated permease PerM